MLRLNRKVKTRNKVSILRCGTLALNGYKFTLRQRVTTGYANDSMSGYVALSRAIIVENDFEKAISAITNITKGRKSPPITLICQRPSLQ